MRLKNYSNEDLIMLLQDEFDEVVFEELVHRFNTVFLKDYRRRRVEGYDTDDYRQEGRLVLLDAINKFDSSKMDCFAPFFYISYKNRIFNIVRDTFAEKRGGRTKDLSLMFNKTNEVSEEFTILDYIEDSYNIPANKWMEIRDIENRYIPLLSSLEQQVFAYYLFGKTRGEISKLMNIEYTVVQSAIERCRSKMKRLLDE